MTTKLSMYLQEVVFEGRMSYWQRLRRARSEYLNGSGAESTSNITMESDFYYWMQRTYGIRMEFIDGKISGSYTIVDPRKELLFKLKYT